MKKPLTVTPDSRPPYKLLIGSFDSCTEAEEVINAANCHDELVEALEGCANLLEYGVPSDKQAHIYAVKARAALAKAKEGQKWVKIPHKQPLTMV